MARHFVRARLTAVGADAELVEDAELVTSELVTNAVMHAGTPVHVAVVVDDAGVTLEVHDRNAAPPRLGAAASPGARAGRGLGLVDALSSDWGFARGRGGKVVWARFVGRRQGWPG